MYTLTMLLPKDTSKLEEKYGQVLAKVNHSKYTVEQWEAILEECKKEPDLT